MVYRTLYHLVSRLILTRVLLCWHCFSLCFTNGAQKDHAAGP